MSNRKQECCFVETHKTELNILQFCDDPKVTYFKDETDNHNKTLVTVTNTTETHFCAMELIVNGESFPGILPGRSFAVQMENVRSVKIKCHDLIPTVTQPQPTMTTFPGILECTGVLKIEKTFCIHCCKDSDSD